MTNLLTRLRSLEAKATRAPWLETKLQGGFSVNRYVRWFATGEDQFYDPSDDAALIAEMRNALPKLLAFVQAYDELETLLSSDESNPNVFSRALNKRYEARAALEDK